MAMTMTMTQATQKRAARVAAPADQPYQRRGWRVYDLPALAIPESAETVAQERVYNALDFLQSTFTVWPSYTAMSPAERRRMRRSFTRAGQALLDLVARDDGRHRLRHRLETHHAS